MERLGACLDSVVADFRQTNSITLGHNEKWETQKNTGEGKQLHLSFRSVESDSLQKLKTLSAGH